MAEPDRPAEARMPHHGGAVGPELAGRAVRTCPNCGRELLQRSCKLYCPDPACGFFLSCADHL